MSRQGIMLPLRLSNPILAQTQLRMLAKKYVVHARKDGQNQEKLIGFNVLLADLGGSIAHVLG